MTERGWYGERAPELIETPPVPADWYRDEPPRDLRERFAGSIVDSDNFVTRARQLLTADAAWSLINAAWDRIESEEYHGETYREAWLAALRAAIAERERG